MVAMLFTNPLVIPSSLQMWLLLPLCAVVALIYKTVRTHHVRRLAIETLLAFLYMIGGIAALSAVLWVLTEYWPY